MEKTLNPIIKRILNIIFIVVSALLVLYILILSVPVIFGYQVMAIKSPSMEDELPVGSLIFVRECTFEEVAVNDIATFVSNKRSNTSFTHRVVEILTDEREFVTKGDSNDRNDQVPSPESNLVGVVSFSFPIAGYPVIWFENTIFMLFIISGILIYIGFETERKINRKVST